MAQGITLAYSYNKFHATLTMRAQNTISAHIRPHACLKLGFAALKFVGGILGNHLSNPRGPPIPGPRAHI